MDDFKTIYKILRTLQLAMDLEEFDIFSLSPEALKLTEPRWNRLMSMLLKEGYITGGQAWDALDCPCPRVSLTRPEITLKGLEYLQENSLMKKAANIARGIKDIVPGI